MIDIPKFYQIPEVGLNLNKYVQIFKPEQNQNSCPSITTKDLKTGDFTQYLIQVGEGCRIPVDPFIAGLENLDANKGIQLTESQLAMLKRQLDPRNKGYLETTGEGDILLPREPGRKLDQPDLVQYTIHNPDFSETTLTASTDEIIGMLNGITAVPEASPELIQIPITTVPEQPLPQSPVATATPEPSQTFQTQPAGNPETPNVIKTDLVTIVGTCSTLLLGVGMAGLTLLVFRLWLKERHKPSAKEAKKKKDKATTKEEVRPQPEAKTAEAPIEEKPEKDSVSKEGVISVVTVTPSEAEAARASRHFIFFQEL